MRDRHMNVIRWGIIGCGDVTEVKSGPGFQKAENSALAAVMRRNGALAADYARRHGVLKWYDDARKLILDPDVDAVYVATPPASHKEYALLAADAGKPAYVEKPMALNYQESKEMVQYCDERNVPLFVAYYRRAQHKFLTVRDILHAGEIGDVRFARIMLHRPPGEDELSGGPLPWRVIPEISGGGHFVDLGSHTFDLVDFLCGPIAEVRGFAANQGGLYPAEDIVAGSWVCESGIHGTGVWCFTAGETVDEFTLVGSLGSVTFSVFGTEPIQVTSCVSASVPQTREILYEIPEHVEQPLIQTIVDELLGKSGVCPSTGTSALRTARVLDRIRMG